MVQNSSSCNTDYSQDLFYHIYFESSTTYIFGTGTGKQGQRAESKMAIHDVAKAVTIFAAKKDEV